MAADVTGAVPASDLSASDRTASGRTACARRLPFAPEAASPAIIVPLTGADPAALAEQASAAAAVSGVDVLEWRVDALSSVAEAVAGSADDLASLLAPAWEAVRAAGLPVLATVRTDAEGGAFPVGEDAGAGYAALVRALIALRPAAVDVEFARPGADGLIVAAAAAGVSPLASAHDWSSTPQADEIVDLLARMAAAGAQTAKAACMPRTRGDALTVLEAASAASSTLDVPVVVIAMGALGRATRVVGADFGSAATFGAVGAGSAPGQVAAADLARIREMLGC